MAPLIILNSTKRTVLRRPAVWMIGSTASGCTLIIWKVRCRALISSASDVALRFFDHEASLQHRRFGLEP